MDLELVFPELMWAGTEHALAVARNAFDPKAIAQIMASNHAPADGEPPVLFSQQDSVGVITIKGPLVNRDSWINAFLGVTSYADIRRAMVHAAESPDVKSILLDVDSGGGAVSGMFDTAELIKSIDKVKPVHAFTDGVMASAALALGVSGRKVGASRTAVVGSLGVLATHMEYSEALKKEGVGATVLRAGKYKALVNSIEPLTSDAKAQAMEQLQATYDVFLEHVRDQREPKATLDSFDKRAGQGREFVGESAVKAGLVDQVTSFDKFMGGLLKRGVATKTAPSHTSVNFAQGTEMIKAKKALTEEQLAALAAGAAPEALGIEIEQQAEAEGSTEVQADAEGAKDDAAEGTQTQAAAQVTEPQTGNDSVVALLKEQLAAANETVHTARNEAAAAKAALEALQATHTPLMAAVTDHLANMRIGLRLPVVDMTKASASELLAAHAAASEQFKKQFRAGGVAAVKAEEPKPEQPKQLMTAMQAARLQAVLFQPKSK